MCDVFLIFRAMLRSLSRVIQMRFCRDGPLGDARTAIHSEKSRRLMSSFAEGLSSPPLPVPPCPRTHPASRYQLFILPLGIFTRFRPVHLHALRYLHTLLKFRIHCGEWDFMSCSSFPVGRSGPTRVAPPERQLEIREGSDEGLSRNSGDLSLWTVRFSEDYARSRSSIRHRTALDLSLS